MGAKTERMAMVDWPSRLAQVQHAGDSANRSFTGSATGQVGKKGGPVTK